MLQVPAKVWNEIAETERLRSKAMDLLFRMNDRQMAAQMDAQAKALKEAKKGDALVIGAYLKLGPLLVENEAISRYIERTESSDLRTALPELTTVPETLELAQMEYRLDEKQLSQLQALLSKLAA